MRWRRVCESRPGQRCASDIQLNDSLVWFRSVKLNSGPTHWLCPWTSWWLIFFFLLSGFLWQPLKWTERIEQLLPTPNPNQSLQHVQCILCMSYIESVRLVFLRAKPLLSKWDYPHWEAFSAPLSHTLYASFIMWCFFSLSLSLKDRLIVKPHAMCFSTTVFWGDNNVALQGNTENQSFEAPLYVIADISAPFGGAENCFNNECGSRGEMRGHLDVRACRGKPTVYRAVPLGYAVFHVCL